MKSSLVIALIGAVASVHIEANGDMQEYNTPNSLAQDVGDEELSPK